MFGCEVFDVVYRFLKGQDQVIDVQFGVWRVVGVCNVYLEGQQVYIFYGSFGVLFGYRVFVNRRGS